VFSYPAPNGNMAKVGAALSSLLGASPFWREKSSSNCVRTETGSCITPAMHEASMDSVALEVKPWESGKFRFVKKLEDAGRNRGRVDRMESSDHEGVDVAVKKMPNSWVTKDHAEFVSVHPRETEQPWKDMLRLLSIQGFPLCKLLDVYRNDENTYVVTELASGGDLFSWCLGGPPAGPEREALSRPLAPQIFAAVGWLHELNVAHRDLSPENILLTGETGAGGLQIRLIDFGMAVCGRTQTSSSSMQRAGKPSYQAPELHALQEYDAFKADCFSTGVVLFAMVAKNYPWLSTKPGRSTAFEYVCCHGPDEFLKCNSPIRALSSEFIELLSSLLQVKPSWRPQLSRHSPRRAQTSASLSESAVKRSLESVWDSPWVVDSSLARFPTVSSVSTMATLDDDGAERTETITAI